MASNIGVYPFVSTTPVGQMRSILGDDEPVQIDPPNGVTGSYVLYSDAALESMLLTFGNVKRATAQAIRSAAVAKVMLLGKWRTDDLSVDYAAVAEAMRKLALDLDNSANGDDIRASADIFEIVYPEQPRCHCKPELAAWPISTCRCS